MSRKDKKARHKKLKTILSACYSADPSSLPEADDMRKMPTPEGTVWSEATIPWPSRITEKTKIVFYIRLLWSFQLAVEERMNTVPGEKGVRDFSLFPDSTSYTVAHVKINAMTLFGICSRIKKDKGVLMTDVWGLADVPFNMKSFQRNRWAVLRAAFEVGQFETRRDDCDLTKDAFANLSTEEKYETAAHLFANQVTSDGYSASVLLFRPKTPEELNGKKAKAETSNELEFAAGYMPNVVIRLNPGMRTMCAAVREDLRPRRLRRRPKREKRRKRPPRQLRKKPSRPIRAKKKPPKHRSGRDIVSVSAGEYNHMANFNQFRTWHEGLMVRHPAFASANREMPSFKTASFGAYLEPLRYFWATLHVLLAFHAEWPFLKWKFLRKRMACTALDEIAARIVPTPSSLTCEAYGN